MKRIIKESIAAINQVLVSFELLIIKLMNKKSVVTLQSIIISMAN